MPDTQPTPREELHRHLAPLVYSDRQAHKLIDAFEQHVLAAAVRRVGLLQAANDGTLIAASREQILRAIADTSQEA